MTLHSGSSFLNGAAILSAAAVGAAVAFVAAPDLPADATRTASEVTVKPAEIPPVANRDSTHAGSGVGVNPPDPRSPVAATVITNGPRNGPGVAITLDADLSYWTLQRVQSGQYPAQVNTSVLDYLESSGTPATVFVTGLWAQEYPEVMQRMAASDLYELANHTWSHEAWTPNCYRLPFIDDPSIQTDQTQQTSELIASYTGEYPAYFRFPGLCHDPSDVALVANLGMQVVDTDVAAGDAFVTDPNLAAVEISSRSQPGSVIVLHLNGSPNAAATATILTHLVPQLRARGLVPMTLSELLAQ